MFGHKLITDPCVTGVFSLDELNHLALARVNFYVVELLIVTGKYHERKNFNPLRDKGTL